MNLSHIPDAELDRIADGLTPQQASIERARRRQQSQALAEMEYYTSLSVTLSNQIDQVLADYEMHYRSLAEALATNPESKLIPELANLYRSSLSLNDLAWQYVFACLFCGSMSDPLITDLRGKPAKGRAAIMEFIWNSRNLGNEIVRGKAGDELQKRTGRRELFSFPEPLSPLQVALINTAIDLAQGKR